MTMVMTNEAHHSILQKRLRNRLSTARLIGDLSHDDYLQELKRRGILRADFDISANEDRLLQEVPLAS